MPPWRSASVTTPCGSEIQPRICGSGGPPLALLRAVEPHQFGGAAADVEQHHAVGVRIDQRRAAGRRQAAPRSRGRSLQARGRAPRATRARKSSPFSAARQASVAIRRARVTPLLCILLRQMASAATRALDRRFAHAAASGDALAEPDDAGKRIDHAEAVAGRPRHQQPAIVGAEIERGIGRARRGRCPRRRRAVQATADPTGTALAAPDRKQGRGPGYPRPRRSYVSSLPAAPGPPPSAPQGAASVPSIAKSLTAPVAHATLMPESYSCGSGWPALSE